MHAVLEARRAAPAILYLPHLQVGASHTCFECILMHTSLPHITAIYLKNGT